MTVLVLACLLRVSTGALPLASVCPTPRVAEHPVRELHRVVPVMQRAHGWRT
jgi:hypothetical protein